MPDRIYQLLVIEDSPSDVRLLKEVLLRWKIRHCLHIADDGAEALDFINRQGNYHGAPTPDLIFLDLNMPRVDGFQVLQCIRESQNTSISAIPVVILTSSSNPHEILLAYELGANIYLTKPADIDDFARMMEGVETFCLRLASLPPS